MSTVSPVVPKSTGRFCEDEKGEERQEQKDNEKNEERGIGR